MLGQPIPWPLAYRHRGRYRFAVVIALLSCAPTEAGWVTARQDRGSQSSGLRHGRVSSTRPELVGTVRLDLWRKSMTEGADIRTARLPEIRGLGDRECVLNWIGQARRHPNDHARYQVFVRFAALSTNTRCDAWVSLDRFPLLILGSRWRQGLMVGKPLGVRTFTICADREPNWQDVSMTENPRRLCFGLGYPLTFDRPASPVLQVNSRRGEILYLPLSELLRSHYFSIPRALPSLLGGQMLFGSLASQGLQAWHAAGTGWLDKAAGIASIQRARFITEYQALCLARMLFSNEGEQNLKRLKQWVDTEFQVHPFRTRAEERSDLPRLGLPYRVGRWSAVAQRLQNAQTGQPRYLILQLISFDSDEPYQELAIATQGETTTGGNNPNGDDEARSYGKRLDPLVDEGSFELQDELADASLTPITLEDILPVDAASKRRRPIRNAENHMPSRSIAATPSRSIVVSAGSMRESGAGGKGNAPIRPGQSRDEWPVRSDALRLLNDALHRALEPYLKAHRDLGFAANAASLPSKDEAYAFEIRPAESDSFAKARQFLVIRVAIDSKNAYIFDAERLGSDTFPLAVLARRGEHVFGEFSTEQVELVAQIFDRERRASRSWVTAKDLCEAFTVRAVRHPPQVETTRREMDAFIGRIVNRVLAQIGDVRVFSCSLQSPSSSRSERSPAV